MMSNNQAKPKKLTAVLLLLLVAPAVLFYLQKRKTAVVFLLLMWVGAFLLPWLNPPFIKAIAFFMVYGYLSFVVFSYFKTQEGERSNTNSDNDLEPTNIIIPWYSQWWSAILLSVIALLAFAASKVFLVQTFSIPSNSMLPNIQVGDMIFSNNLMTKLDKNHIANIKRGDIYVYASAEGYYKVARLVGLPEDVVSLKNDVLFVNAKQITQTHKLAKPKGTEEYASYYLENFANNSYQIRNLVDFSPKYASGTWLVPKNHVFFLGDNRDNAFDSRFNGAIHKDKLVGRVFAVRKPLFK